MCTPEEIATTLNDLQITPELESSGRIRNLLVPLGEESDAEKRPLTEAELDEFGIDPDNIGVSVMYLAVGQPQYVLHRIYPSNLSLLE